MLLTAHHVDSPEKGNGINAFRHLHGREFLWPDDAASLPETCPGVLDEARTRIAPGGNPVCAYLDIIAPDGTASNEILEALDHMTFNLAQLPNPTVVKYRTVTVRFGTDIGKQNQRLQELSELSRVLRELLPSDLGEHS